MGELASVVLLFGAVIYFLPFVIANARHHPQQGSIFFLNLIVGWTVIGWFAVLVWAFVGREETPKTGPSQATHTRCPDCAESVLKEARVCKHCGCKLNQATVS